MGHTPSPLRPTLLSEVVQGRVTIPRSLPGAPLQPPSPGPLSSLDTQIPLLTVLLVSVSVSSAREFHSKQGLTHLSPKCPPLDLALQPH
jgi:hypothetical protein